MMWTRTDQTAKYTTLNQRVRFVLSSWERGPLARRRAGRPRSQVKPYCRVLSQTDKSPPWQLRPIAIGRGLAGEHHRSCGRMDR